MKLTALFAPLILPAFVSAYIATYDNFYDTATSPISEVACSELGAEYGWTTVSQIPSYPNIGGAYAITGYASASCGTCWNLTYTSPYTGESTSISVTAIDTAPNGFNIAEAAMNTLTDNQAIALGSVTVESAQIAASACGL